MKVKVRTEFKDKHTGKLHKAGDELEMNVDRINEVLKVGNFIELVADAAEPKKSEADKRNRQKTPIPKQIRKMLPKMPRKQRAGEKNK